MSDRPKSVELVDEIAKDAFGDALEILQIIELMKRQNTSGINKALSAKGAAGPATAIRNSFIARITTLVARCYSKVTREDDRHLRRAFECLEDPLVRSAIETRSSKQAVAEVEQLWKKLDASDAIERVNQFRHKLTAHWAKPNPDIAIPTYAEFFEFADATTRVIEKLAHAVGGKGDTFDQFRKKHAASAETFWKPWEATIRDNSRSSSTFFRLVRHTYNQQGGLAERAILSGRHETEAAATAAANKEAAKNAPWKFEKEKGHWRITDKHDREHFLSVEK